MAFDIVAVDAMGGDHGCGTVVKGAIEYLKENNDVRIALVGKERLLKKELKKNGMEDNDSIFIVNAPTEVSMRDQFLTYWRKREKTSIKKGLDLIKNGEADSLISTGNTGAVMAISKDILGLLKNIDRPALSIMLPTLKGQSLLLDAGANVDSKPKNLVQFALMGKVYLENVIGVKNPRIALMSIGEEDSKGNELTKTTFAILKKLDINFIGNIEGKDIHIGEADLIVTDGFTGNVTLKVSEGIVDLMASLLRREIKASLFSKIGIFFLKSSMKKIKKKLDYSEYGGALLLGVNGVVIIGHGKSNVNAIKNAIEQSREFVKKKVVEKIGLEIAAMEKMFKELKYV